MSQAADGLGQLGTQFADILAAHVTQLHMLELLPHPFIRIQLGRITGQCLKVNVFRSDLLHEAVGCVNRTV